jgi:hypothetical protein
MSPIAFKPKSDVLCLAGALRPFERTTKPSDLTYTTFLGFHLEQMVGVKNKLPPKKIMRLRRRRTMSFSLCAVIAEAMGRKQKPTSDEMGSESLLAQCTG